nr:hypothetical protein Iba_chr02fCG8660 [Ipomoea batatas]
MPSLKCCRTGDSSGDDDEGSRNHKRIKENNKNEGVLPAASARRSRRRCNSVQWVWSTTDYGRQRQAVLLLRRREALRSHIARTGRRRNQR